jgi:hypothetical protein
VIQAPVRLDDFKSSQFEAPREWMEELSAIARVAPQDIIPLETGFVLQVKDSLRWQQWRYEKSNTRPLFQLAATSLDRFDTTLLVPHRTPIGKPHAVAVCPWRNVPEAAQKLRTAYIGPDFRAAQANPDDILPAYKRDILEALGLAELPLNGQPPGYCDLKWGTLLRLGPAEFERAIDYLAIASPTNPVEAVRLDLGADIFAFGAFSASTKEPLRVGIYRRWYDDLALKDASRWLHSFLPSPGKKDSRTPS